MRSVSKNFLYNLIYQIFVFIIPLVTVPYISRVLGVNNVGIYSYSYSIISYFMLASMLGINNYGSREIAKSADNLEKRSKTFFSIYFLQLLFSVVMCLLFLLFYLMYNYEYKNILFIQMIYLVSCAFDINWYFFGMEKFKITISRNIIIKISSLVLIFLLVKTVDDLWIYTLILSGSTLISQMYLWIFMRKEVCFVKVSMKDIFSNLSKCLVLFVPVIAYSIYRIMDKTMIGSMADTIQLGNYESAEKIVTIPLSIISALGIVMLPHMSKAKDSEYSKKIISTFRLCFFMLFPIFIGLMIVSNDFSNVFYGKNFILTPNLIRILLITILFSGVTNIIRNNYLIPKAKDSIYVKSTIYGALVNLILNLIFIRKYGAYGACIGTISAELVVMVYQMVKTKQNISFSKCFVSIMPFLKNSILMGLIIYMIGLFLNSNIYIKLIVQIFSAIIVYFFLNKDYILHEFLGRKKET